MTEERLSTSHPTASTSEDITHTSAATEAITPSPACPPDDHSKDIVPPAAVTETSSSASPDNVSGLNEGFLTSAVGSPLASSTQASETCWSEGNEDLMAMAQQAEEAQEKSFNMTVSSSIYKKKTNLYLDLLDSWRLVYI